MPRRFASVLAGLAVLTALVVRAQDIKPRAPAGQPSASTTSPADAAREMYYATNGKGQGKHVGVKVRLYQMSQDCDLSLVPPGKTFSSGERLRFGVEANVNGYLYIVQRGSSGRTLMLFPSAEIGKGDNQLRRGTELTVPGRKWFTFDATPGTEQVQFVVSRKRLDIIPHLVGGSAGSAPASRPSATSAEGEVLAQMQGTGNRDLVMTPSTPPPAVHTAASAESSTYDPVYAVNQGDGEYAVLTIALNHR